jgi:predicted nucleic acid-binding protein
MLIVADTSALVALAAAEGLWLLDRLFQDVRVPAAVFHECTVPDKLEAERLEAYLRDKVLAVDLEKLIIAVAGLGQGELEAMALYKQLRADRLLVDDSRARKVARLNGIEVVGSLGILLQAKKSGLIPEIRSILEAIQAAGVHYGSQLVAEALRLAGEEDGREAPAEL